MPNVTGMRLLALPDGSYDLVSTFVDSKHKFSASGSSTRPIFKRTYDGAHTAHYTKVKDVNMYERIQSYAKSCDIVTLMARYAAGDSECLHQREGAYGDFTGLGDPQSMYGAYASMKGVFDQLGEQEKAQFGNSFESFLYDLAVRASTPAIGSEGVIEEKKEVTPNES